MFSDYAAVISNVRGEDVRAVANEIFFANKNHRRLTNLAMQKVIYFLHGQYLLSTGAPLVAGYFEAWEHGPVHPLLYDSLKHLGSQPLRTPLRKRSIHSGVWEDIPIIADANVRQFLLSGSPSLLNLTARQLVDLSHAPRSPWDVVTQGGARRFWGSRLDNETIKRYFRFHKRSVFESIDGDSLEERAPS